MKTLIAYTSTHGAAAECARKLAPRLHGEAEIADLKIGPVPDLAPYDCVVLGSSIYGGSIGKEMTAFCKIDLGKLMHKPLGIFFSCFTEDEPTLQQYLKRNFSPQLAEHAAAFESFGGALYFSKMNPIERWFTAKMMHVAAKNRGGNFTFDGKTDYTAFADDKISAFAERMNNAMQEDGTCGN